MSSGGTTWSFDYNADGLRYRRSNGSTTYTYYYNGDMLRYLDINGTKLYFVLDANGQPIEVSYKPVNSTTTSFYFYVHNLQGDVTAIVDTNGTTVVQYAYDAWGKILSTTGSMASTLGQQNPFRYRSYVYDQETGLYYLQSRYYNPTIGRFINADAFAATGQGILGNNMFAYCNNNPVSYADPSGHALVVCMKDDHDPTLGMFIGLTGGGGSGGGAAYALPTVGELINKVDERVNNESVAVVQADLMTDGYSFYRGRLVVKLDIMGGLHFRLARFLRDPNLLRIC